MMNLSSCTVTNYHSPAHDIDTSGDVWVEVGQGEELELSATDYAILRLNLIWQILQMINVVIPAGM